MEEDFEEYEDRHERFVRLANRVVSDATEKAAEAIRKVKGFNTADEELAKECAKVAINAYTLAMRDSVEKINPFK